MKDKFTTYVVSKNKTTAIRIAKKDLSRELNKKGYKIKSLKLNSVSKTNMVGNGKSEYKVVLDVVC
tara:strand:+ start:1050 stop:1247 length:198 start_codon:yes stop_codon:yes gene_type:complete